MPGGGGRGEEVESNGVFLSTEEAAVVTSCLRCLMYSRARWKEQQADGFFFLSTTESLGVRRSYNLVGCSTPEEVLCIAGAGVCGSRPQTRQTTNPNNGVVESCVTGAFCLNCRYFSIMSESERTDECRTVLYNRSLPTIKPPKRSGPSCPRLSGLPTRVGLLSAKRRA